MASGHGKMTGGGFGLAPFLVSWLALPARSLRATIGTLGTSVEKVGEEVRQEVHEATAPEEKASTPGQHRPPLASMT
jgi:hypothetical protein